MKIKIVLGTHGVFSSPLLFFALEEFTNVIC